jgi:hypothetical protein
MNLFQKENCTMKRNVIMTAVAFVLALVAGGAKAQSEQYWMQLEAINAEISNVETTLAKTGAIVLEEARQARSLHRAYELGRSHSKIAQGIDAVRTDLKHASATLAGVKTQITDLYVALGTVAAAAEKLGDAKLAYAASQAKLRLDAAQLELARQQRSIQKTLTSLDELETKLKA